MARVPAAGTLALIARVPAVGTLALKKCMARVPAAHYCDCRHSRPEQTYTVGEQLASAKLIVMYAVA